MRTALILISAGAVFFLLVRAGYGEGEEESLLARIASLEQKLQAIESGAAITPTLRAHRIMIVDESGRQRAFLGASEAPGSGAKFELFDDAGISRFELCQHDDGDVSMVMSGANGAPLVTIKASHSDAFATGMTRVFSKRAEELVKSSDLWGGMLTFSRDGKITERVPAD